jgi:hypothetical protein
VVDSTLISFNLLRFHFSRRLAAVSLPFTRASVCLSRLAMWSPIAVTQANAVLKRGMAVRWRDFKVQHFPLFERHPPFLIFVSLLKVFSFSHMSRTRPTDYNTRRLHPGVHHHPTHRPQAGHRRGVSARRASAAGDHHVVRALGRRGGAPRRVLALPRAHSLGEGRGLRAQGEEEQRGWEKGGGGGVWGSATFVRSSTLSGSQRRHIHSRTPFPAPRRPPRWRR